MESTAEAPFRTILLFKQDDAPIDRAEDHREALFAAFDASAAGDSGPFQAMFDPDIVFHVSPVMPYGGAHHGVEATRAALRMAHGCYDQARVEIEDLMFGGDKALAYLRLNFRVRKTGVTGVMPMIEVYRFRGGKMIEWRAYHFDPCHMAALLAAE